MKVLELFGGTGSWSVPFKEDGDETVGIDIVDVGYRGDKLILQDVRKVKGKDFEDMDVVCGSPPCIEFSDTKLNFRWHPDGQDIQKGLELVHEFERIVSEIEPRIWFMENVTHLAWWYPRNPIWHFMVSRGGRRALWGNLDLPLAQEWHFNRSLYRDYNSKQKAERGMIPYAITRFIADCVKKAI